MSEAETGSGPESKLRGTLSPGEVARRAEETAELEALLPDAEGEVEEQIEEIEEDESPEEADQEESAETKEQLRAMAGALQESCGVMAKAAKGFAGDQSLLGDIGELNSKVRGLNYELDDRDQAGQEAIGHLVRAFSRYDEAIVPLQMRLGSLVAPLEQGSPELGQQVDGLVSNPDTAVAQMSADNINTMISGCMQAVTYAEQDITASERALRQAANSALEQVPYSSPIHRRLDTIVQDELNVRLRRSAMTREKSGQDAASYASRSRDILGQMAALRT